MSRMTRLWTRLWLIVAACVSLAGAADGQSALKLPPHKKVKLENGLTVLLMEQREVPIVGLRVLVRAGSVADPAGKEGLAAVTAELLRRGTRTRTADQIAGEVDFVGGTLEFRAGHDFTSGSAEFLKKDLGVGLELLSDVLRNPVFPLAEVAKLLRQNIDEIKQQKDEAQGVIERYFNAYLFGAHPYARPATGDERSLAKLTRADVARFYEGHYGPGATIIAVAGDFEAGEAERLLREKFGGWRSGAGAGAVKLADPPPASGRRLLLVDKPDSTQTYFQIGNVGVARAHPDRVGIALVNTVFGARFTSMLNEALRVNSGLTYGAFSSFDERRVAGAFAISSFTRNATTAEAIDLALEVLGRLHEQGLSEEQLGSAKSYLKGQFPTRVETPGQLAELLAELEYYGLDEREVNDYFARLDAVTSAEARRIIREHFPRENLVFVLIGKAAEIRPAAAKYASQVEAREIVHPGFN